MKRITTAQIASRCSQTVHYRSQRELMHRLRRLTAGDASALGDGASATSSATDDAITRLYKGSDSEFADVLVTEIEEGRSNKLFQAVRTLALQTSLKYPDANFEDLESNLAVLNAQYFTARGARCGLTQQAFTVLLDYLICGIGAAYVGVRDGYPVVDRVDPLDITWDHSASSFETIKWASWVHRRSLGDWKELFPNNPKLDLIEGDEDTPISVVCYYDVHGEKGNQAYFLSSSSGHSAVSEDDLIDRDDNPYRASESGVLVPTVPLVFMTSIGLPGTTVPSSVVQSVLPAQVALWRAEKAIAEIVDKSAPYWMMAEDSVTEESLDAWKDGEPGAILVVKDGKQGLSVGGGIDFNQTLIEQRNSNEREVTAQSGANPYATGTPVKGVSYAAEVNAIQGQAGLVAGHVAKDVANWWERLIVKFISVGADYDDKPIRLMFRTANESVPLEFDETDPITFYLKPESRVTVSEDTLLYEPKEKRIARALANLEVALKVGLPTAVTKAYEEYLRANGEKDVAAWFEQPQVNPAQMMQESTVGMAA